ncbi:ribulokinase [Heyndrickxia ginsengihumi]|uniref:ribulokinase n=1 Tax=Heyndrickxia ginsengihumi TaxID=363870 RepID=UPI003D2565B9
MVEINSYDKFTIGLDYGTLSARAVLVNTANGEVVAEAVKEYRHGVIKDKIGNRQLPAHWALQSADDYLEALYTIIPEVIEKSGVTKERVIGIGIDFTSCTMLPASKNGKALHQIEKFKDHPHAYVKLWKHHAAQSYAEKINETGNSRNEEFIKAYNRQISSEWLFPKILQIFKEDPEIYAKTDCFIEAGDWLVWQLSGNLKRSICHSGYKAMWQGKYPSKEYFRSLDKEFGNVVEEKLPGEMIHLGQSVGNISSRMAEKLGLSYKTVIASSVIDAHAAVPAVNATREGTMVAVIGTSTCHLVVSEKLNYLQGVKGVVKDGIIEGLYAYECGQAAVGDMFDWFIRNQVSKHYFEAAAEMNMGIHDYLSERASSLNPGGRGILALDWWNGSRIDNRPDLSGVLYGFDLDTKAEEIYRALIEASGFGTKLIIEKFERGGMPIKEFYACGGISKKNQLLVQIYADILDFPIKVSYLEHASAVGAAMYAAVAAGMKEGGYDTIQDATEAMADRHVHTVYPHKERTKMYQQLYELYREAREENLNSKVLQKLQDMKNDARV